MGFYWICIWYKLLGTASTDDTWCALLPVNPLIAKPEVEREEAAPTLAVCTEPLKGSLLMTMAWSLMVGSWTELLA